MTYSLSSRDLWSQVSKLLLFHAYLSPNSRVLYRCRSSTVRCWALSHEIFWVALFSMLFNLIKLNDEIIRGFFFSEKRYCSELLSVSKVRKFYNRNGNSNIFLFLKIYRFKRRTYVRFSWMETKYWIQQIFINIFCKYLENAFQTKRI